MSPGGGEEDDEVPLADRIEQAEGDDGRAVPDRAPEPVIDLEVPEADAFEQAMPVDRDEDDWPRR